MPQNDGANIRCFNGISKFLIEKKRNKAPKMLIHRYIYYKNSSFQFSFWNELQCLASLSSDRQPVNDVAVGRRETDANLGKRPSVNGVFLGIAFLLNLGDCGLR